jgi:copper chaperone
MEKLKFKTNINCSGCVKAVTPHLEKTQGINSWKVDTDSPEKILTVDANGANAEDVIDVIEKAGFKAEKID